MLLADGDGNDDSALLPGQWSTCTRCGIATKVRGHYMGPDNLQTWCCCAECDRGISERTKCIWPVDRSSIRRDE